MPAAGQLATADQLKSKAFEALRAGKFDLTNEYLLQAAAASKDPTVERMALWTGQFEAQHKVFQDQRRHEYEKTVGYVNLLVGRGKPTYAMEQAQKAYSLAEDKAAFLAEPWMVKLVADARSLAEEYEKEQQWLKSLRLYSQLGTIEPDNAQWKERMKTSARRIRLIAMYVPEDWKRIKDADAKERDEIELLLNPTTRPTTKPAEDEADNQNKVDWRDTLRDVRLDMLHEALVCARANYYRDVSYQKMILGGLTGLRVLITTPSLDRTFAGLHDGKKLAEFLGAIDASVAQAERAKTADEQESLLDIVPRLKKINDGSVALPEEVFTSEFADGAFATLDLFSNVMWPSEWDEFQKSTQGQFSGVGIEIQSDDAGYLKVVQPIADSPADEAGIKPDYIITHINGKSARWIDTSQAVKLITGPPNTTVTLTIRTPKGEVTDIVLTRRTIKPGSVKGWMPKTHGTWDYYIDPEQRIAYMRLSSFSKTTVDDLNRALTEISKNGGARGIIFDLRYNPGGLLNAATEVVDRFVPGGKVIVTQRPDRPDSPNQNVPAILSRRSKDDLDTPLILLVNQFSASASEIVSGALKDYKRSLIVGERTFGKGSVQMVYPLGEQKAVLKLTTSHYYLPGGECIHREETSKTWGVEPDVTVEMTPDQTREAISSRKSHDVMRDADSKPVEPVANDAESKSAKDPLATDPQLSAALLLMRLQLAGAQL